MTGDCRVVLSEKGGVARELTKHFEEFRRGSARSLLEHYKQKTVKGEICLLVAPNELPKWITW
jgi:16S rRNA (cytidine1402-2'-O)-methyltransferase